ncbi:toxin-antitoxin system TumE family protein [Phyllobacterium leguminum]|uniref:Uncharacterized protein n=1 Tax=Phyllobacterium leguminum TaxID=314237 RepID=A0A318TFJ1_9HYPH|nr:DUF6516 family protein [Phyllobacterium leguminum]PYE90452.1 hypothetical protein C7477_101125 [Phyllobacterium leguminum]
MGAARKIIKRRIDLTEDSFVELSVFEVPKPLAGSKHSFKYRLAYVVSKVCVMRYDNEVGKGDHKHVGRREFSYDFVDVDTLLDDFFAEVERMNYDGANN